MSIIAGKPWGKVYRPWGKWEYRCDYTDTDTETIYNHVFRVDKEPDDSAMQDAIDARKAELESEASIKITDISIIDSRLAILEIEIADAIKERDDLIAIRALLVDADILPVRK